MIYIVGNWKSNHNQTQTHIWLELFATLQPTINPTTNTTLCLPFTDLPEVNRFLTQTPLPLYLGAQDVSPFPPGSHTGEIDANMLSELVTFCIVGHSERRREARETSKDVLAKTKNLLYANITPIICIDTPYLDEQISLLSKANINFNKCIFAYEPAASIGSGKPENANSAQKVCAQIAFLVGADSPILYGGSIDASNVAEYISQPNISGVLVGGQSLDPTNFYQLILAAQL